MKLLSTPTFLFWANLVCFALNMFLYIEVTHAKFDLMVALICLVGAVMMDLQIKHIKSEKDDKKED